MSPGDYLLDNRADDAGKRFDALSAIFNPVTARHFEKLGVDRGWKCWDVGAGGSSVPRWLAARVGPTGYVLATDIDIGWITGDLGAHVEVRNHDVARDKPPSGQFDLVHARLVLSHLPDRDVALQRMVESLRPGGWLLIEDFDGALQPLACVDGQRPEHRRANKLRHGFMALLSQHGLQLEYGRSLPRLLRARGLSEVSADAYFPVAVPAGAALDKANISQVRDGLITQGLATAEEISEHLAAIDAGLLDITTPPLISAWGRQGQPTN